jgi:hypothetical protein
MNAAAARALNTPPMNRSLGFFFGAGSIEMPNE